MRILLILILVSLLLSPQTHAQYGGSIGLFSDQYGNDCSVLDAPGQIVYVWVVHAYTSGATASEFRIQDPGCMMYLTEYPDELFLAIGSFRDGISIAYNGCFSSPIVLGYLMYFAQGFCSPCTYMRIVDHPYPSVVIPGIWVYDCTVPTPNVLMATGGELIINPSIECNCYIPVEDATWGQIKALYSD